MSLGRSHQGGSLDRLDPSGNLYGHGILAALHWRGMTGEGQALDVATAEAYVSVDDWAACGIRGGVINERFGSLDTAGWLYCFAPTKDGAVFLGGLRLEMWQAFADMVGKWDEWGAASWTDLSPFMEEEQQLKWRRWSCRDTQIHQRGTVSMSVEYARRVVWLPLRRWWRPWVLLRVPCKIPTG